LLNGLPKDHVNTSLFFDGLNSANLQSNLLLYVNGALSQYLDSIPVGNYASFATGATIQGYIFTMIDHYSKFLWSRAFSTKEAQPI